MRQKKYIDLFAGCGGLSLGLHNAGWKGLFAIEKNPDAFETLEHNLINKLDHYEWPAWLPKTSLDIKDVLANYKKDLKSLRGHVDMVAGGPPCQGFSMAGRRDEADVRNGLVDSYIEFIRLVRPNVIFFENVKGFTLQFKKNKDKGIAYSAYVSEKLRNSGYQIYGELVNFGDYGIPQKRTRFILVGIKRDLLNGEKCVAKQFFKKLSDNRGLFLKSKNISISTNLEDAISDLLMQNGTVLSPDTKNFAAGLYSEVTSEYQKLMRKDTWGNPDSHRFAKHRDSIVNKFEVLLKESRRNKDVDKELRKRFNIKKHTVIPLSGKEKSPTITTLPDDYIHYKEPRILTVREYARIQSFPDNYIFKGKYTTGGKRRTQEVPRYTQIGNAIPPLFGEQAGLVLKTLVNNG